MREERQKGGWRGEKERVGVFCPGLISVKHWSIRIHSHTTALSSLDKLPSASAHAANPELNLCERITCVLQMTDWTLVACVDWQAEETTFCCLKRANWSDTGMSQE